MLKGAREDIPGEVFGRFTSLLAAALQYLVHKQQHYMIILTKGSSRRRALSQRPSGPHLGLVGGQAAREVRERRLAQLAVLGEQLAAAQGAVGAPLQVRAVLGAHRAHAARLPLRMQQRPPLLV